MKKLPTVLDPRAAPEVAQRVRSRHAAWFAIADEVHRIAADALPEVEPPQTDNTRLLAAALFGRMVTSFQSAYVLAELGLCGDARTVIRAMAESAIVLAALVMNPTQVTDLLVERHIWNERTLIGAWLDDPQAVAASSPENLARLRKRLAEIKAQHPKVKRDPVDIRALAQSSNLLWLYNTAYRMLSGDAAHTSVLSLERHVRTNAASEIIGLQFGPNPNEVPDTLSAAIPVMLNATHTVTALFDLPQYKARLDKTLATWQAMSPPP